MRTLTEDQERWIEDFGFRLSGRYDDSGYRVSVYITDDGYGFAMLESYAVSGEEPRVLRPVYPYPTETLDDQIAAVFESVIEDRRLTSNV